MRQRSHCHLISAVIVLTIFAAEWGIMTLVSRLDGVPLWAAALADTILLCIIMFPAVYLLAFRPLLINIEELSLMKERYASLITNLGPEYFVYMHDDKGVFTYVSPQIKTMLGYEPDDFKKHYSTYLTDNPVNKNVDEHTSLSLIGVRQPLYSAEIFHKNGKKMWLEVAERPIFAPDGRVKAVEGIAHDITKFKTTEEENRKKIDELENFYRLTLGREKRVMELKDEIERLKTELKKHGILELK